MFYSQELLTIDTGVARNDNLGQDVALSGDAQVMAVGAHLVDLNGLYNVGHVRLYSKNGMDWNMCQQIDGPPLSNNNFGYSVDLSHDGSTLAVSALYYAVYFYELSNITDRYELLDATAIIQAREVSVSGDGSTVGVTSTFVSRGARIFARIGNVFQQRGSTFSGYGYVSGIALNYNGTIAAIGQRNWATSRGRVGVFQLTDAKNGDWMQMGSYISGDAASNYFGDHGCVSITHEGLTIAVGAWGYNGDGGDKGLVRVYNYVTTENTWEMSLDLVGDNSYDYLSTTSLSSDGKFLIAGAWGGNYIKILEKIGSNYEIVGEKVTSGEGGYFGGSVDMSADMTAVAIGAYRFNNYKGRAYLLVSNNLANSPSSVSVNETSSFLSTIPSFAPNTSSLSIPLSPHLSGNGNGGMYP